MGNIGNIDAQMVLAQIVVIFFSIGLHEYAHCKFADMAGDPTPRYYGRVTLNLFKHFDPIGSIFILWTILGGLGIGWGRPAPMNPAKMNNPRWDWFIAVIAGPLTNVLLAVVCGLTLRIALKFGLFIGGGSTSKFLFLVLAMGVLMNLALALFNMIPFGPLDGKWLLGLLMPERQRYAWFKLNQQIGIFGLFIVIMLLRYSNISLLSGPILSGFRFLTGIDY